MKKRKMSKITHDWWDFTTLDDEILNDAAKLTLKDIQQLNREGFTVHLYNTLEQFFLAEAMEYVLAWKQSTADNPVGICGPVGPTEQLPLVAKIINDLDLNVQDGHFWGMDEWVENGQDMDINNPLSFTKADMDLCFNRLKPELRIPDAHLHFPGVNNLEQFSKSFDDIRCKVMQGGQGEVKHWAFNDPLMRKGAYADAPPSPEAYRELKTRIVELHPITLMQNARTSGGGQVAKIPTSAVTVGPQETWKAEKVSIWHTGWHDNPFGIRLTSLMVSKGIVDSSVPMSLLADHPNVHFHYYVPALKDVNIEMH